MKILFAAIVMALALTACDTMGKSYTHSYQSMEADGPSDAN